MITLQVSCEGNSKFNPASVSVSVEVKTKVIITDVYGYYDKLVACLTNGATGNAIINANMVSDIKTTVKSDSKGQISFDTSDLGLAAYDVSISYAGKSRYAPSSATTTIGLDKTNMNIKYVYDAE